MSRRTTAGVVAACLLLLLSVAAALLPVPYVTYAPGLTVDVLAEREGREIVQVSGAESYHDGGELRMTTVYVSRPGARVTLLDAMVAWLDDDRALYPYDAIYGEEETDESSETESAIEMVSSQDTATAVALRELGYDVQPVVEVLNVERGLPADGLLEVRDILLSVDGVRVRTSQQVVDRVQGVPPGESVRFEVSRGDRRLTVAVEPRLVDGTPRVGVTTGPGYRFPFEVDVAVPDEIGGPSAGLMFSLAIYDTLTPGPLTGGAVVAGSGTLDAQGRVGPIGGIQQKIVAASQAQAELFLVPPDNCAEAVRAPVDGIRLVEAATMAQARRSVAAWARDHDAPLPACEAT